MIHARKAFSELSNEALEEANAIVKKAEAEYIRMGGTAKEVESDLDARCRLSFVVGWLTGSLQTAILEGKLKARKEEAL